MTLEETQLDSRCWGFLNLADCYSVGHSSINSTSLSIMKRTAFSIGNEEIGPWDDDLLMNSKYEFGFHLSLSSHVITQDVKTSRRGA